MINTHFEQQGRALAIKLIESKSKMMWRVKVNQLVTKISACIYRRLVWRIALILTITLLTVAIVLLLQPPKPPPTEEEKEQELIARLNIVLENDMWIPDGGDNITGWPRDIVPDIVHYVLFKQHNISYVHMLSLFSVIKIHKPASIVIHCDCDRIDEGDLHYERVLRLLNETNEITLYINEIAMPTQIHGIPLSDGWAVFHGSDVTRYQTLMKYGGIYLDNDVFVCQSLHEYRKFEFTLNWNGEDKAVFGSQVLIANRNARFLKFVMETYKAYDRDRWYYNTAHLPTKAILWKYPHLIHRVQNQFMDGYVSCHYFYSEYHADWQTKSTFHMLARGNQVEWKQFCVGDKNDPMRDAIFSDELFRNLNTTFGEMGRFVLFGTKALLGDEVKLNEAAGFGGAHRRGHKRFRA